MAVNLQAWLHSAVKTQLDLAHSWLADQHTAKAQRARPAAAIDRRWEGIYHDNGSCIDIAGPFSTPARAQVLVLQTEPLVITDGHHHCETALTSACRSALLAHHPDRHLTPGAVCIVTKYVVRYTSYGSPRRKLRLLLDHLDWVGLHPVNQGRADPANALNRAHDIASTLQKLDHARRREDIRCLQAHTSQEEDLDNRTPTMAGANESPNGDSTQMPFGTQMPHSPRPRRDSGEVAFLGINRMEPVLAGNTQRAELKPRSASSNPARPYAHLLSLINKAPPSAPPQSPSRHVPTGPRALNEHNAMRPSRPTEPRIERTNHERLEDSHAGATQTPTDKGKKRRREGEHNSPSTHQSAKKTSFSEDDSRHSRASELAKFAAECSWMKGLNLSHASATVPENQALLLQKPESWYKAEPGQRSVNEVPAQILVVLSRMADEAAALEGATSSGSFRDTNPSSASYPANSAPQLIEEESSDSEDEAATSPVSWQTSPSPQPPQRPTFSRQGLPPDSSLEMPQDGAEAVSSQSSKGHKPSQDRALPVSSHEHGTGFPPSSPPDRPAAADSNDNMELEISVPQALEEEPLPRPSTQSHMARAEPRPRSVVQVAETPYVKGSNAQQPVVTVLPPTQTCNAQSENSSSASIVRGTYQDLSSSAVEETRLDAVQGDSGEHLQRTAVTNVFDTPGPARAASVRDESERPTRNLGTDTAQDKNPLQPEPTPMSAQLPPKDSSSGEQAALTPNKADHTMPLQPSIGATRRASATPALNKRKRSPTPPQGVRQGRKRTKHLKKVLFIKKDGDERLQSTTGAESRHGSISDQSVQRVADVKMDDLETKKPTQPQATENIVVVEPEMSPRHQSLYASPSPVLRPVPKPVIPVSESVVLPQAVHEPIVAGRSATEDATTTQQSKIQPPPKTPSVPPDAPQAEPASALPPAPEHTPVPEPQQPEPSVAFRTEHVLPAAPVDVQVPRTVSEMFKAAYPEYKGSVKHFSNQCKQIEKLDREDRMVPKYMWDDFIIRNHTDYNLYVRDCLDAGEDPMPYIRFYKDTIDHTIYTNKIVASRDVLLKALQELGAQPIASETSPQPPSIGQDVPIRGHQSPAPLTQQPRHARSHQHPNRQSVQASPIPPQQQADPMPPPTQPLITPPRKKKRPRSSLPFSTPSASTPARTSGTATTRHSLDASLSRAAATATPSSTATRSTTFGEKLRFYKNSILSSSQDDSTGQEIRDFVNAQEKLTSATGSRRGVESRPTVFSMLPRRKMDVLEWSDEL